MFKVKQCQVKCEAHSSEENVGYRMKGGDLLTEETCLVRYDIQR